MIRGVFFSFQYREDAWRVSQVRNMGAVDAGPVLHGNEWERLEEAGDQAIERWIFDQMEDKECLVLLIGETTADSSWVQFELHCALQMGIGVVGVHFHRLKDARGVQGCKGRNPMKDVYVEQYGDSCCEGPLSDVVHSYMPPFRNSQDVYAYIEEHLEGWVENAISEAGWHPLA